MFDIFALSCDGWLGDRIIKHNSYI